MTPNEVLTAAADLLEKPGAWTQGQAARNSNGQAVGPKSHFATCWCLLGALDKASGLRDPGSTLYTQARRFIQGQLPIAPSLWNDKASRTQPQVVALLRRAAVKAKEAGQ